MKHIEHVLNLNDHFIISLSTAFIYYLDWGRQESDPQLQQDGRRAHGVRDALPSRMVQGRRDRKIR